MLSRSPVPPLPLPRRVPTHTEAEPFASFKHGEAKTHLDVLRGGDDPPALQIRRVRGCRRDARIVIAHGPELDALEAAIKAVRAVAPLAKAA